MSKASSEDYMKAFKSCDFEKKEQKKLDTPAMTPLEQELEEFCTIYLENARAYVSNETVYNPRMRTYDAPDETFMHSVERSVGLPEQHAWPFRNAVVLKASQSADDAGLKEIFLKALLGHKEEMLEYWGACIEPKKKIKAEISELKEMLAELEGRH